MANNYFERENKKSTIRTDNDFNQIVCVFPFANLLSQWKKIARKSTAYRKHIKQIDS